jgi:protein SCO1/2
MNKGDDPGAAQRGLRRGLLIAGGLALGVLIVTLGQYFFAARQGLTITGKPLIGGAFELVDQNGRTVHDSDFRGKLLLVYFGYSLCPDVCPTTLQAIGLGLDQLGAKAAEVQPLFITVDPARDTPAVLKPYVANFHPSLLGLTGTSEQIQAATKAYRVYWSKNMKAAELDYLVDHSGFIYLMDRNGQYLAHFPPDATADAIAARVRAAL